MSKRPQADPATARYKEKCNAILLISPRIRYTGVMNRFGRMLAGGLRKGVTPMLKPEEARNEYFIEATRSMLRKNFDNSIGRTEYTLTANEKVWISTIPSEDRIYFISIDKETPIQDVMNIIDAARKMASK
ncbi:MAG: DUF6659 family protein [Nitrososphaera sp.]